MGSSGQGNEAPPSKSAPLRILHVPQAYPPVIGGGEVLAQRVSEGLVARGHEVAVLTSSLVKMWARRDDDTGVANQNVFQEQMGGVSVERFPAQSFLHKHGHLLYSAPMPFRAKVRGFVKERSFSAFADRVLEAITQQDGPDVVLTMMHNCASVRAVTEAREKTKFPLVVSPQLHHDAPNWCADEVKHYLSYADAVTANTGYEADLLTAEYAVPAENIIVTGGGTDLPPEPGTWPRPPRVLFIGRKHPDKRLDHLIHAMQLIWPDIPEAELVIAGARSRRTPQIESQIAALPEPQRRQVRSPDNIPESEKIDLLRTSRCLVLPSEHESFGLVLVEAWAYGTPVVTNDMPVFQSTVTHDVDGILVEPRDPASLAAGLRKLLESESLAERLGTEGRETVRNKHTWEHVAERYEATLRLGIEKATQAAASS
jgi:glycogen(starch) synthase